MFDDVEATKSERAEARPGDDLGVLADVVIDRGFTVRGSPDGVWPWIVQLGRRRAGWYLSRRVERAIPLARRAIRQIEPRWQKLVELSPRRIVTARHPSPVAARVPANNRQ